MKFEVYKDEDKYRPCLVADIKSLFHMWTSDGKAIVEFDDGTVSTVKAEDIRFLDTESLMAESACFSDEWIERFKNKKETEHSMNTNKVIEFFSELKRLADEHGCNVDSAYNNENNCYRIRVYKLYDNGISILGTRDVYLTDILFYCDGAYMARRAFDLIISSRKEIE